MTPGFRETGPMPPFGRRFAPVWVAGALGVAALSQQPIPPGMREIPELASLHPMALQGLLMLNPLLLMTVAALVGAVLAPRVGLKSWLAGMQPAPLALKRALGLGLLLAAGVVLADRFFAPLIGGSWQDLVQRAPSSPLIVGLFYGGLTEEVMLRWGGLSVSLSVCLWLARNRNRTPDLQLRLGWCAIMLMAAAFAAGHLPALSSLVPLDAPVVARTLLFNFAAGLVYGHLAWKNSLETAVVAHASTHLGFAAARWAGL